jgi:PAS domain S-box-containing protein
VLQDRREGTFSWFKLAEWFIIRAMPDNERPDDVFLQDFRASAARFPESIASSLAIQSGLVDALFEGSRDIILLTDPGLRIIRASAFAAALMGYGSSELLGKPVGRFLDGSQQGSRLAEAAASLASAEERRSGDFSIVTRGGASVTVRLCVRRLEDRTGNAYGHLVTGGPIPAHGGPAAECGDASNGLVDRVLRGIPDPVLLMDPFDSVVLDCNTASEGLLGRTRIELIGASLLSLHADPAAYRERRKLAAEAYSRAGVWQGDAELARKDGAKVLCGMTEIALFNLDGSLSLVIAIARDLSAERRKEAELSRLISGVSALSAQLALLAASSREPEREESLSALGFTARQSEIARLIVSGASTKEAAFALGLSESTVKNHLAVMFRKIGASSRIDFVRLISERRVKLS